MSDDAIGDVTVETYARLVARQRQRETFGAALRRHGMTRAQWARVSEAWTAHLVSDANARRVDRLRCFAVAFRAEHARIVAEGRGAGPDSTVVASEPVDWGEPLPFRPETRSNAPPPAASAPHEDAGLTAEIAALGPDQTLPFVAPPDPRGEGRRKP
jgi:hypothetical protein